MLKTIENLPVCPGIYDPALVDMAERKRETNLYFVDAKGANVDGETVKCTRSLNCTYKLPVHSKTRCNVKIFYDLAFVGKQNLHLNHLAIQEGKPFIPCRVIPYWLPPNDSYKKLEIDFSTLKFGETILPEQLGLTVAQIGFNT